MSLSHLKSQKNLAATGLHVDHSRDVDQSRATLKSHIYAKPEHIGESSPNAPIIHVFNLVQKRFFQPVSSQNPSHYWSTCGPLRHVDHNDTTGNPFVAYERMNGLSNRQKEFCYKL